MIDPIRCLALGPHAVVCGRLRNHPGSHEGERDDGRRSVVIAWIGGPDAQAWIQGEKPREQTRRQMVMVASMRKRSAR